MFGERLAIAFADPDHSDKEDRVVAFGMSHPNRLLVVSHAERGNRTRIISSRLMTKGERRIYEAG